MRMKVVYDVTRNRPVQRPLPVLCILKGPGTQRTWTPQSLAESLYLESNWLTEEFPGKCCMQKISEFLFDNPLQKEHGKEWKLQ